MNPEFPAPQSSPQATPSEASEQNSSPSETKENADWISAALPPVAVATPQFSAPPAPLPSPIPNPQVPYQPPMQQSVPQDQQGDGTGGLIPYKNPMALLGYYVSVFGLIPCAGMVLGPAAIVMGIMGLKYNKANPHTKGTAHAWVAIVLGSIELLAHLAFIAMVVGSA